MAKKGGFPGGMPGNMNNLMKQAQRMQRQMEEKQKELEEKVWEASSGGGAVTVQMSGKKEMTSIKISPEVIDPDDVEMLQDLIIAAVNEVWKKMDEESDEVYGSIGNGLGSSFSGFGF
ncbi:MAG: YbaB/EbfC family nucleoid-associated protein [Lachnospiraceae bacterium]|nr:YbaB/EbfC family nucleoid-associated protein [Lachnospiraceae bacterium]